MPRPPTLDPLGVFNPPHIVDDPEREAKIVASFVARVKYLERNYIRAKALLSQEQPTFNESLARLKRQIERLDKGKGVPFEQSARTRLHPELELLINSRARELAGVGVDIFLAPEHQNFVRAAAQEVASKWRARPGRPPQSLFQYYVEALVALLVEVTGQPVIGQRTKDSDYSPHLGTRLGTVVRQFADGVEPGLTDTALVDMLCKIRRKYVGKAMRFEDFFPFYAGEISEGSPQPGEGYRLEAFMPIQPIYCP